MKYLRAAAKEGTLSMHLLTQGLLPRSSGATDRETRISSGHISRLYVIRRRVRNVEKRFWLPPSFIYVSVLRIHTHTRTHVGCIDFAISRVMAFAPAARSSRPDVYVCVRVCVGAMRCAAYRRELYARRPMQYIYVVPTLVAARHYILQYIICWVHWMRLWEVGAFPWNFWISLVLREVSCETTLLNSLWCCIFSIRVGCNFIYSCAVFSGRI